jgi:hypothetical protein
MMMYARCIAIAIMDPITSQFVCSAPESTATLAKHANPKFIVDALDEFARFKQTQNSMGNRINDRLAGLHMQFTPSGPPILERVNIMALEPDISQDGPFGFIDLLKNAPFVNYLKAMFSIALIDHFFEHKKFTREAMMTPAEILFANDFRTVPYDRTNKHNGGFHMDAISDISPYQFSLTFVVPTNETIRGTTFVSASKDATKPSLSVALQNGTTLLAKQFTNDNRELLWHSNPIQLIGQSTRTHRPNAPVRNPHFLPEIHFTEVPTTIQRMDELDAMHKIGASVVQPRTFCRNHYYRIDDVDIGNWRHPINQHTTAAMNAALMPMLDAAWLEQIIAFMESNRARVDQLSCASETPSGIDAALVEMGLVIGVGGDNKSRNARRNKRRSKRCNARRSKRCNTRRSKRSYTPFLI